MFVPKLSCRLLHRDVCCPHDSTVTDNKQKLVSGWDQAWATCRRSIFKLWCSGLHVQLLFPIRLPPFMFSVCVLMQFSAWRWRSVWTLLLFCHVDTDPDCRSISQLFPWLCEQWQSEGKVDSPSIFLSTKKVKCPWVQTDRWILKLLQCLFVFLSPVHTSIESRDVSTRVFPPLYFHCGAALPSLTITLVPREDRRRSHAHTENNFIFCCKSKNLIKSWHIRELWWQTQTKSNLLLLGQWFTPLDSS